ncbi:MAG: prepilin-type N-terminal cleavage/methylation domain-containing protein [Dehalococcoidia bacterium]|jgi:prepilin-type N-terminal cleavage/methylation domain-containing protein|nr:prepilin-type N-terminal cleavage/methylation domain-containing protein [Dehalococcoidia bacterium]
MSARFTERPPRRPPVPVCHQAGYTLIELMVSMAIMVGVTGTIFTLVHPSQAAFRVQPEIADMHQRMRVASDRLSTDLLMAGAGADQGTGKGALNDLFAPVVPYRAGLTDADPERGVFFRPDAISLLYVPDTVAQTTVAHPIPSGSVNVRVNPIPGCPPHDALCGFEEGQTVMIVDETGAKDLFTVIAVQASTLHLQHHGPQLSNAYGAGASISEVEMHIYYRDTTADELRHYDGASSDLPLVDDVVGLRFRYFGDPNPPPAPKPAIGVENCLFDVDGHPRLATLPGGASLVELTEAMLTDGPFCGVPGGTLFDADLHRVRSIRVDLRVQVSADDLRGADPALFVRPGQAIQGSRLVPDFGVSFEVSPRNMNLR